MRNDDTNMIESTIDSADPTSLHVLADYWEERHGSAAVAALRKHLRQRDVADAAIARAAARPYRYCTAQVAFVVDALRMYESRACRILRLFATNQTAAKAMVLHYYLSGLLTLSLLLTRYQRAKTAAWHGWYLHSVLQHVGLCQPSATSEAAVTRVCDWPVRWTLSDAPVTYNSATPEICRSWLRSNLGAITFTSDLSAAHLGFACHAGLLAALLHEGDAPWMRALSR